MNERAKPDADVVAGAFFRLFANGCSQQRHSKTRPAAAPAFGHRTRNQNLAAGALALTLGELQHESRKEDEKERMRLRLLPGPCCTKRGQTAPHCAIGSGPCGSLGQIGCFPQKSIGNDELALSVAGMRSRTIDHSAKKPVAVQRRDGS